MVKVFSFAVDEGKVVVHCHAGLGEHYLESDAGHMMSCDLDYRYNWSTCSMLSNILSAHHCR